MVEALGKNIYYGGASKLKSINIVIYETSVLRLVLMYLRMRKFA